MTKQNKKKRNSRAGLQNNNSLDLMPLAYNKDQHQQEKLQEDFARSCLDSTRYNSLFRPNLHHIGKPVLRLFLLCSPALPARI